MFYYLFFSVPANYKFSRAPGAVEVILEEPDHPNNILIGYNRGLVVLWDRAEAKSLKTFVSNQQLESLCWRNSDQFVSSHIDGNKIRVNVCILCTLNLNYRQLLYLEFG